MKQLKNAYRWSLFLRMVSVRPEHKITLQSYIDSGRSLNSQDYFLMSNFQILFLTCEIGLVHFSNTE